MEDWLQLFEYAHLKPELQAASAPFCELARHVIKDWPDNQETQTALRKLLEAKDAAVRGKFFKKRTQIVNNPDVD